MSYTGLYRFTKSGYPKKFAEISNSHRGAMAIWRTLEKRYLPEYIPTWAVRLPKQEPFYYTRVNDGNYDELWDLSLDDKVSEVDKICLISTFDNAIVYRKDILRLTNAFRRFDGETSLKEQADKIDKYMQLDKSFIAIGWNQTSVNADAWLSPKSSIGYNILTETNHINVFENS